MFLEKVKIIFSQKIVYAIKKSVCDYKAISYQLNTSLKSMLSGKSFSLSCHVIQFFFYKAIRCDTLYDNFGIKFIVLGCKAQVLFRERKFCTMYLPVKIFNVKIS